MERIMNDQYFMKTPCKHCPFRTDVRPFLHPERAEQIAYHASNEFNTFSCHKTLEHDEDDDEGGLMVTEDSKECAGFLSLQINEGARIPDGFTPSMDVYESIHAMIEAYEDQWCADRSNKKVDK
jgi:hypothetical protein